mmetsp:Transcript_3942/g.11516  ORF Transcript_3942/g.11516 Transcript_3942/m.11516 type:complete len:719 (-) Transcript_3942:57-2213(-)
MQLGRTLSLVLLSATLPASVARRAAENPLGQVLKLLDGLAAKVTKEGEQEEKTYKAFIEWCDDASANKGFEIKTATAKKEKLEAAITKSTSDEEAAEAKIEELAGSISTDEADLKSATQVREKESANFGANEAELADVVDTIGRAIVAIEREMAKNPASFAQMDISSVDKLLKSLGSVVDAAAFPSADKQKLLSMVQSQQSSGGEDEDLGAPAAAAYKSHSSSILDVLEDMKEKAEEQLAELRKAETSAAHNYAMLKQSLEDQVAADSKSLSEEKSSLAAAGESKATAEGDLDETVKDLADSKGSLEVAQTQCMQAAADHDASTKARKEELDAISKAKQVLQESSAGAVGQTYSFLQEERSQAGSELRTRADLANAEVVTIVKRLAKQNKSPQLAQLASRIEAIMRFGAGAGEDPFQKVRALISELLASLEAEAQGEATEKAYCDEQLAETEEKKASLNHDISKLTAKIDQAVAKTTDLKGQVKELQSELAQLAKEQAEMDQIRRDSHKAFVQAKADLEAGLQGVRRALSVLREYYQGGSGSAAMVQEGESLGNAMRQEPVVPGTHSKATGAGSSIIGLLEVVESDFAKNLAAEEVQEDDAEVEYQKTTQVNKVTTKLKDQDVKYSSAEIKKLDQSVAELTADRDTSDAELSAVLEYYAKIKERCIAKPETYEERKARREAEVKGLKEALAILEDEAAFVQRGKKGPTRSRFLGLARE